MLPTDATWFITGCSKGLGRAMAEHALEMGHRVVLTARNTSKLAALTTGREDRALILELDVTQQAQVESAVEQAEAWGGIDVLVNNAGYGYLGAIEEGVEEEVRAMYETNFYGVIRTLKAALPAMRDRRRGHVVNVTSMGGIATFPAVGYYNSTKFALEGISDTLAQELAPFGVGVTIVEPGAFRTDFRGGSMKQSSVRLAAYEDTAGSARDKIIAADGVQPNDPRLGAAVIFEALRATEPPHRLLLGKDALTVVRAQLDRLAADFNAWEGLSAQTAYPEGAG